MLLTGIEHEFVFADARGRYLDADVADYELFRSIVDAMPLYENDANYLDCKSLESRPKRCYVEGFERHDASGKRIETLPKGIEIRTLPHDSIDGVLAEFRDSYARMTRAAESRGIRPLLTSRHPYKTNITSLEQLPGVEAERRTPERLALARRAMLTHGLHVNVSCGEWSDDDLADRVAKVRYYTPALIPWSFSSPFHQGEVWKGLCSRNYLRAESRSMADVQQRKGISLIEFRGFDAPGDHRLLKALLVLFCGFLLDERLEGRADRQDAQAIRVSSLAGYDDPQIRQQCQHVLTAARDALPGHGASFALLQSMLDRNDSYAARLKVRYAEYGSILRSIEGLYDF